MKQNVIVPIVFLLLLFISFGLVAEAQTPDSAYIYYASPYSATIVAIRCDDLKKMDNVKLKILPSTRKVKKAFSLFSDLSNFDEDKEVKYLDVRLSIYFKRSGKIIKKVCWQPLLNRIEMDAKIYRPNSKVEKFLLSIYHW